MKIIETNCGKSLLVDEEDYPILARFNWGLNGDGYARASVQSSLVFMHRLILGAKPDGNWSVDHINRNTLDNRKSNLRWADKQGNSANSDTRNKLGFKGVRKVRNAKRFNAYITVDGKQKHLGNYDLIEDAAKAYDKAALTYFGKFARLNFGEAK